MIQTYQDQTHFTVILHRHRETGEEQYYYATEEFAKYYKILLEKNEIPYIVIQQ